MHKTYQQGFEAKGVQVELTTASARRSQIDPVNPHPDIAQERCNANKQQPQGGIAGGGLDASPTELSIAGLGAETMPVAVEDPLGGFRLQCPKRHEPGFAGHGGGIGRTDDDNAP